MLLLRHNYLASMDTFPAFKEWAIVCAALGKGQQSILIRKGGIAEGKLGFQFKHEKFFLFPTFFHERIEKTQWQDSQFSFYKGNILEIRYLASIEWVRFIQDNETIVALREFHILQDSVIQERFQSNRRLGVYVALVRVFCLSPPHYIPYEKKYGGCRSWVQVPTKQHESILLPVMNDTLHQQRKQLIEEIVNSAC